MPPREQRKKAHERVKIERRGASVPPGAGGIGPRLMVTKEYHIGKDKMSNR